MDVQLIHRNRGIAILSNGEEVPVLKWLNVGGECSPDKAKICICGPCSDGKWYSVDLRRLDVATIH